VCEEEAASHYCVQCTDYLCGACLTHHARVKRTRGSFFGGIYWRKVDIFCFLQVTPELKLCRNCWEVSRSEWTEIPSIGCLGGSSHEPVLCEVCEVPQICLFFPLVSFLAPAFFFFFYQDANSTHFCRACGNESNCKQIVKGVAFSSISLLGVFGTTSKSDFFFFFHLTLISPLC